MNYNFIQSITTISYQNIVSIIPLSQDKCRFREPGAAVADCQVVLADL